CWAEVLAFFGAEIWACMESRAAAMATAACANASRSARGIWVACMADEACCRAWAETRGAAPARETSAMAIARVELALGSETRAGRRTKTSGNHDAADAVGYLRILPDAGGCSGNMP